jgi:hypothetical protein
MQIEPRSSFRINLWLRKDQWFEREILPVLKARVDEPLNVSDKNPAAAVE